MYLCNCIACSAHVPQNLKCNKKIKILKKEISGDSKQGNFRQFQERPLQSMKFQAISGKAIPDNATPRNSWKQKQNQEHFKE